MSHVQNGILPTSALIGDGHRFLQPSGHLIFMLGADACAESYFGNMNAIPKPATVMLGERRLHGCEEAALQDVLAHQSIPDWLA